MSTVHVSSTSSSSPSSVITLAYTLLYMSLSFIQSCSPPRRSHVIDFSIPCCCNHCFCRVHPYAPIFSTDHICWCLGDNGYRCSRICRLDGCGSLNSRLYNFLTDELVIPMSREYIYFFIYYVYILSYLSICLFSNFVMYLLFLRIFTLCACARVLSRLCVCACALVSACSCAHASVRASVRVLVCMSVRFVLCVRWACLVFRSCVMSVFIVCVVSTNDCTFCSVDAVSHIIFLLVYCAQTTSRRTWFTVRYGAMAVFSTVSHILESGSVSAGSFRYTVMHST